MRLVAKNRHQAFGVHFLISLFIVINFAYLIFFYWYPEPYFSADGGWVVFRIIIIVDLVLGPVLTFIIYKPGKKGLKFDLSAIAIVQISALLYGGVILYTEQPVYLTFAVDRFVLLSEGDVDDSKIPNLSLLKQDSVKPWLVYARLPEDPDEQQKLMSEVLAGKPDLEYRAEYYEPFSENLKNVLSKSLDISLLKKISIVYQEKIESFVAEHCAEGCGFFPLVGKKRDVLLALDKKSGSIVGGLDIDPWSKPVQ